MTFPNWIIIACILFLLAMTFFLLYIDVDTPIVIISGSSMTPTVLPGDVVLIKREHINDITIHDIIAFVSVNDGNSQQNDEKKTVVHRVVNITTDEYNRVFLITRGDFNFNNDDELVTESNYIGKMYFVIPKVGNAITLVKNPIVFAIIGIVIVLIYLYDTKYIRHVALNS